MAELKFITGPMGAAKTVMALTQRYRYLEIGTTVYLIKPDADTSEGLTKVYSRIGIEAEAIPIKKDENIATIILSLYLPQNAVIIADEAQFFSAKQIEQLRYIASVIDRRVICYGLRTDFRGELFEGSRALLALADTIQMIDYACDCGEKAIINARLDENGNVMTEGAQLLLRSAVQYKPMCWKCWSEKTGKKDDVLL